MKDFTILPTAGVTMFVLPSGVFDTKLKMQDRLFYKPVHSKKMSSTTSQIKTVLLIDDDQDDCLVFKMALAEIDPSIQLFYENCGDTILETLSFITPDIIFLDIKLPRVDGLECLAIIKESVAYQKVPVVIYSSSEYIKDLSASYRDGAVLYFRKPSSITSLTQSLEKILEMNWNNPEAIRSQYCGNGKYQAI